LIQLTAPCNSTTEITLLVFELNIIYGSLGMKNISTDEQIERVSRLTAFLDQHRFAISRGMFIARAKKAKQTMRVQKR